MNRPGEILHTYVQLGKTLVQGPVMIAVSYPDRYAVMETFQLLKIPWEWYVPGRKYETVIAKRGDVPGYDGKLIDLTERDIFKTINDLLNAGRLHLHEPACDILLDAFRKELKAAAVLIEIPPIPWGNPYMVALTHDVDVTTVRECRLRTAAFAAFRCVMHGDITAGIRLLFARCGFGSDPWALFPEWKALESGLGVRSTFFFVPRKGDSGALAHPYRAVRYDIPGGSVRDLMDGGWEVGIHGLDNWRDVGIGREEIAALGSAHKNPGNRTHWLIMDAMSFRALDKAGYSYDTTFGYNDDAGFRAGTLQAYRPRGATELLELPLHIQDIGLLGKSCRAPTADGWTTTPCLHLDKAAARLHCNRIFDYAATFGGAVTLLWHYENLVPPCDWGDLYTELVKRALSDGAWVTTAGEIVDWFRVRRDTTLGMDVREKNITIRLNGLRQIPGHPVRVRLFINPSQIASVTTEYVPGTEYVDIRGDVPEITITLR